MKFEFYNLETRFHKRQVSFLVVKTVKCKRSIGFVCNHLLSTRFELLAKE